MDTWKQIRAIILLPGTVTILIPGIILYFDGIHTPSPPWKYVLPIIGCAFICCGLILFVITVRLFIKVGKGTLAPWNPPKKLVIRGIYRHVRNPMILGVFCILIGESALFGSLALLCWFGVFSFLNMIIIPLGEERDLAKRFGDDYLLYKRNVSRWIPGTKPWEGLSEDNVTGEEKEKRPNDKTE